MNIKADLLTDGWRTGCHVNEYEKIISDRTFVLVMDEEKCQFDLFVTFVTDIPLEQTLAARGILLTRADLAFSVDALLNTLSRLSK